MAGIMIEVMTQIHMTEAEVSGNFSAVLQKIGCGEEVVVDRDGQPVAVIRTPPAADRLLSESIAIARQRERERGYAVTLDPDFAADVEEIVRNRQPWNPASWE
jgi:antitoxin (DNA-binding transcriptional repressor) of toxin-antitoxin stability system